MELKVGMYVRTERGKIAKIISKEDMSGSLHQECWVWKLDDLSTLAINSQKVTKASYNLIDLIEVGDFLNHQCVSKIENDTLYFENGYFLAFEDFDDLVDTIVTHEQFNSVEYEVY